MLTGEQRIMKLNEQRWLCAYCGRPLDVMTAQAAHRIADTKSNRRKYGNDIVDAYENIAMTHAGRCNDGMNIGFNPGKCTQLINRIREHDICRTTIR